MEYIVCVSLLLFILFKVFTTKYFKKSDEFARWILQQEQISNNIFNENDSLGVYINIPEEFKELLVKDFVFTPWVYTRGGISFEVGRLHSFSNEYYVIVEKA